MPGDEYTSISGGLKLKGSKPSGISKTKKSKKAKAKPSKPGDESIPDIVVTETQNEDGGADKKEGDDAASRETDSKDEDGKTASERQFEEVRRKRVCAPSIPSISGVVRIRGVRVDLCRCMIDWRVRE
jgi:protein FAM32A